MSERTRQQVNKKGASAAIEKAATAPPLAGMQNSRAIRWYVLTLPSCHRGSARELQAEAERRKRSGEPPFEFFAPTYVEVTQKNGHWVETARPLLYNYVFVKASENEIYHLMQTRLSLYSFLPRVKEGKNSHYPYLMDEAMRNLRWVARSYADVVPVYTPEPERLMKGDRVRITEGKFKNAEASVIIQPGAGRKDIMVCIDNWMWVPLLHVLPGQYEVIALHTANTHIYTRLNNDRLFLALHEALQRYHSTTLTEKDRALAEETRLQYGSLRMDSDVTRCKLYALLLPAYTILGDKKACQRTVGVMQALLSAVRAEQSRALLLVTLYGCTDNCIYYDRAHALVDPWRAEENPKKSKVQLMRRLDDYDMWLGHRK
jgi:transcription antitermination factor NusG